MARFQQAFERCRKQGKAALMPYMTAGDPSLAWTKRLIDEVIASGADMIELGMPYSDPIADGPTVQAAGERALRAGTTIDGLFDLVRAVRRDHDVPIAVLIYYNCVFRTGEERFVRRAKACGIDGLIIPDLPPEEGDNIQAVAKECGMDIIYLAAPTSTDARLRKIVRQASAFLYCVSLTGVTGARQEVSQHLAPFLKRVQEAARHEGKDLPLAVGFGISTPEHVSYVSQHADGVIVGSSLIDRLHGEGTLDDGVAACGALIRSMRQAADAKSDRKERSA